MKKLFLIFIVGIFLIGTISASEWDNALKYKNNDLTVEIDNACIPIINLCFGDKIGETTLKSHSSVNEIKNVMRGKDRLVMWYDFNFGELYKNGLGDVEFTDERTGKKIEKSYYFAQAKYKQVDIYDDVCILRIVEANGTTYETQDCHKEIVRTIKQIYEWDRLDSNEIPKGKSTIGLFTDVLKDDYIDGVWLIAGKRIKKHASWTDSLNTGLVAYYNFENLSAVDNNLTDVVTGDYNGTLTNMENSDWETGKILNGLNFSGTNEDVRAIPNPVGNLSYSVVFWANIGSLSGYQSFVSTSDTDYLQDNFIIRKYNNNGIIQVYQYHDGTSTGKYVESTSSIAVANWTMIAYTYNNSDDTHSLYMNDALEDNTFSADNPSVSDYDYMTIGSRYDTYWLNGTMDELGVWNRTLTSDEIIQLFNEGSGLTYTEAATTYPEINTTLLAPSDAATINTNQTFNSTLTPTNSNLTNATLYVWDSDNDIFNTSINNTFASGTNTATNISFDVVDFSIGNYKWNVYGCSNNTDGYYNCSWGTNRTLSYGATILSIDYGNSTYETSSEQFNVTLNVPSDSEVSTIQLIYNGTNYSVSSFTQTSSNLSLSKTIDIPLVSNLTNETKYFYFRLTYDGDYTQNTSTYNQTVNYINLQQCNDTYTTQALNFTIYDEINQTILNSAANYTDFEAYYSYWLGGGTVVRNYSFKNLSSTNNNYQFCIYPYTENTTFYSDADLEYSAVDYKENSYYLRNSSLTNVSNDILLYLIPTTDATRFLLTFQLGNERIEEATATVQKFFTGEGEYKTVSILLTDDEGEATMWMELDKDYRYSVVQYSSLLGSVDKKSICLEAPCSLTIQIPTDAEDYFEYYYDEYAGNIASNLSYNRTTKVITYNFVDLTGLATYFRLKVDSVMLNETGENICDSSSYSVAGTLTCNLSSYTSGEFKATTYISRSPEKVDSVLNVIIDESIVEDLGLMGILLIMGLIITLVFAGAIVTKGSPSGVLWFLGIGILGLKITGLFPFTWPIVVGLELVILFIISKVKT